jgi:uncharacterized RDD family membrane protein YckC
VSGPELSAVPKEVRAYQGETAGVVTRSVANVIDALVVGEMVAGCYLGLVSIQFLLDPRSFTWPDGHLLLGLTFTLGLSVVYLWLSWWLLGRSYGKHVMGIRLAGRRGRKLGPVRSLARAAFCVVFPIGFFWCAISPRRHSFQDIAVYSSVVYDWMPHPTVAPEGLVNGAADDGDLGSPDGAEPPDDAIEAEPLTRTRRYRWARKIDPYDD